MTDREYYIKYIKGFHFTVSTDEDGTIFLFGDFATNESVFIQWSGEITEYKPIYGLCDVLEYVKNNDWIILKSETRKKTLEKIKNKQNN